MDAVPNRGSWGTFSWVVPATLDDTLAYRVFLRDPVTLLEASSTLFYVNPYLHPVPARCGKAVGAGEGEGRGGGILFSVFEIPSRQAGGSCNLSCALASAHPPPVPPTLIFVPPHPLAFAVVSSMDGTGRVSGLGSRLVVTREVCRVSTLDKTPRVGARHESREGSVCVSQTRALHTAFAPPPPLHPPAPPPPPPPFVRPVLFRHGGTDGWHCLAAYPLDPTCVSSARCSPLRFFSGVDDLESFVAEASRVTGGRLVLLQP
jgi:hypothetical protein